MTYTVPEYADPVRLSELICARLCHDLAGPLSPLAGMVELAREDPAATGEALSVVEDAAAEMGNRLRLLRAAWTRDGGEMDVAGLRALASGLPNARRLRLIFDISAPTALSAGMARVALNLLLLAAESLPVGGTIRLSGDSASELLLRIEGHRAAWPAGLSLVLSNEAAAWKALDGPRTLQAPLTALTARSLGLGLSMLIGIGEAVAAPPLLLTTTPRPLTDKI